jgi:hypothetical protein
MKKKAKVDVPESELKKQRMANGRCAVTAEVEGTKVFKFVGEKEYKALRGAEHVGHREHRSRWRHALLEAGFGRPTDRVFVERAAPTPALARLATPAEDRPVGADGREILLGATVYLARRH